ncbi:hypothetical protein I4641_08580 [Waterburya agarophytonicola K14]|uniref:Uncharacterized protein n=1 Tax=Waterburya agarophytonicola KI4 TaxID=2874699 RepID=A0A964BRT6_9CYAN|nr:hypothetical protein [Waterburya agarophytonicola]MCC0177031.1 hypothetical protein [Waterburya agarophytonicola KI4]
MTNSHNHNHNKNNLVTFLRHNQPITPQPSPDLEQQIIDSLEPRHNRKRYRTVTWSIPSAIATGFLFTTVSFGVRTPRIAIEPKDLENFLVNNWQDTLNARNNNVMSDSEAYWLLPTVSESKQALSVSAQ